MQLRDAVVLVTGASRGIGRAVALELSARGARLVLTGRDGAALDGIGARTGGVAVTADLRETGSADRVVDAALERFGRLDGLIVNAGVGHAGPFAAMTAAQVDAVLQINVVSSVQLVRAALPALTESAGTSGAGIVLVGSIAGLLGVPGESVYSASKAAVETFGVTLREELRPAGIAVTTVAPGVVDTALLAGRGDGYARRFPRPIPPERLAVRMVEALEHTRDRVIEPRWLELAVRIHGVAPRTYRRLSRRFG